MLQSHKLTVNSTSAMVPTALTHTMSLPGSAKNGTRPVLYSSIHILMESSGIFLSTGIQWNLMESDGLNLPSQNL